MHRLVAKPRAQAFAQLLPGQRLLRALVEQLAMLGDEGRQVTGQQTKRQHRGG
ncbi:hypothetical protein D9M71_411550 [compost metagenome]